MARLVSLQQLQTRVLQRANLKTGTSNTNGLIDAAGSAFVGYVGELVDDINEGLAELYDLIIEQQDQPYYLESTTFSTTANADTYAIGSGQTINVGDFYKARGFDVAVGQNIVITAKPFMWSERNRFKYLSGWIYSQPIFYHLVGKTSAVANSGQDAVKFIPAPSGGFVVTMWYFPTPPVLVNATDQFDGINGFEEFAVLSAAIKLLTKQERLEHAQLLMGLKEQERARIVGSLGSHDAENPPRVQDTMLNDGWIGRPGY